MGIEEEKEEEKMLDGVDTFSAEEIKELTNLNIEHRR